MPLRILVLAALLVAGVQGLGFLPAWQRIEARGFDLLTLTTPVTRPDPDIVIVGIDEPSFAELGRQWPWPREWHARLVRQLRRQGARIIVLDILFADPSDRGDGELAAALAEAGNVFLAKDQVVQETDAFQQVMEIEPIPALREAAVDLGLTGIPLDSDMIVRRIPSDPESLWRKVVGVEPPGNGLVRYYGPSHTFPYVSYYQALEPETFLSPDIFANKIVLVGLDLKTAPLAQGSAVDQFGTPFLGVEQSLTPGVEIHATLIANGVAGDFLVPLAGGWRFFLGAAVLFAGAQAMRRWSPFISALWGGGLILATFTLSWVLFGYFDFWWPFLGTIAGLVLLYTVEGGFSFLGERRRKREIRQSFGRYLSPHVVDQIVANPESLVLGGERRELTIMFTDLAGFTSLAEEHEPEQVTGFLNDYLTEQTRIILDYEGTVDKFIGDAIMAFWGAPLEMSGAAEKACRAALEMQQSMVRLRKRFAAAGWPELHMRIGIHTGPVAVGNMGSEARFDYTAIGDNVNLAARLEGINKLYHTEILLSQETASRLEGSMPLRYVDRVRVKGRSQWIDTYTLLDGEIPLGLQEEAVRAYRAGDWDRAARLWQQFLDSSPHDPIARVYLDRIETLRSRPADPAWDGAFSLDKM